MAAAKALRLEKIVIRLDGRVLIDLSHQVEPGAVLTVMGPSGSGKSSLLAYIGGFLEPVFDAAGRVFHGETELTGLQAADRHTGILFQDPLLFPHMTVRGNLLYAIPDRIGDRTARGKIATEALDGVGLGGFGDRDPATLSGGQKARVALARVLVSEPRALLLDEPFSRLDTELRQQVRSLVFDKAREGRLPVILVTHDEEDARAAGGEIVRIGAA